MKKRQNPTLPKVSPQRRTQHFSVSSANLISKWQGKSKRLVRILFAMVKESAGARAVIFINKLILFAVIKPREIVSHFSEQKQNL
jgi:ATP-dependent 26S proteasome regulatory subunit